MNKTDTETRNVITETKDDKPTNISNFMYPHYIKLLPEILLAYLTTQLYCTNY